MGNARARTLTVLILFIAAIALGMISLAIVCHHRRISDDGAKPEAELLTDAMTDCRGEFAEIASNITSEFNSKDDMRSHVGSCVVGTFERVEKMTNGTLRLAVSRYLAKEVLKLNLTNESYHLRWHNIDAAADAICYADRCLEVSGAPEMERCKFIFDALLHVKDGFLITLSEPRTKPTENDKYGRGELFAQYNCKQRVRRYFAFKPQTLCNIYFRFMYPKLSPEAQAYFKKRFKEVFGIGYIPYSRGKFPWLEGEEGARWNGKGLKWRIWDDNGNSYDAEPED